MHDPQTPGPMAGAAQLTHPWSVKLIHPYSSLSPPFSLEPPQGSIIASLKAGPCCCLPQLFFVPSYAQVIRNAYATYQATPDYMAIAPAEQDFLPSAPSSSSGENGDPTAAGVVDAPSAESAGTSLYPAFRDYPVASVELLRLERERIQASEDALIRRRKVSHTSCPQCKRTTAVYMPSVPLCLTFHQHHLYVFQGSFDQAAGA